MGIECSAPDRAVFLRSVAGRPASVVVRFTNCDQRRVRVRVKPPTHPWLDFDGSHFAPVAGSTRRTRRDPSIKGASTRPGEPAEGIFLSCGGYIEVRVGFTPRDASIARLASTLSIGITRELNSLSMEGAQWKFFEVDVNCETILPFFQLFHPAGLPGEGGEADCAGSKTPQQRSILQFSEPHQTGRERGRGGVGDDSPVEARCAAGSTARLKTRTRRGPSPEGISKAAGALTLHTPPFLSTSAPLDACVFPPTFVLSGITQRYRLVNVGSDAVVSLTCTSAAYAINPPGPIPLAHAAEVDISILFRPMAWEDPCDGQLVLTVWKNPPSEVESAEAGRGIGEGDNLVLVQQCFPLRGTSIVPRVAVRQIGEMTLPHDSPTDFSEPPPKMEGFDEEIIPRYFIPDTCPEVRSTLAVRVFNSCSLPLAYRWVLEVCGGAGDRMNAVRNAEGGSPLDAPASIATIQPARGTMAAMEESVFTVSVNPLVAGRLAISCNLFLEGLPDPTQVSEAELARIPSWIAALYDRHAQIPSATLTVQPAQPWAEEAVASDGAFAASAMDCALMDPFAFFQAHTIPQPSHLQDLVFSTGFYLFAFPADPSLKLISGVLDGTFESLTGIEVSRGVILQNPSPRALHFVWNTPEITLKPSEIGVPAMPISGQGELFQPEKDPISTWCRPRQGCIAPYGQQDIEVSFISHIAGIHHKTLECTVPELQSCHELVLKVKGVCPMVHTNTQFLDFGVIKVDTKHAATFTVSNSNRVPVMCRFQDPMFCNPPRFTFSPTSIQILANDSADITVYRYGIHLDIPEAFFEVVVQGGVAIVIETHAIVQNPQIVLDEPVVDFGFNVPEGVWQERAFYLSNNSNFDITFAMATTSAQTPWVRLEYASDLVLCAGQVHMEVPIRACFLYNPQEKENLDVYCAHIELRSEQTQQVLLVKVYATTIEQLSVSVDVVAASNSQEGIRHDGDTSTNGTSFGMTPTKYVRILLLNALEIALHSVDLQRRPSANHYVQVVDPTSPCHDAGAPFQLSVDHSDSFRGVVVRPFCENVQLHTHLPDHSPVCNATLMVKFTNYSKCTTRGVIWVDEGDSSLLGPLNHSKRGGTLTFFPPLTVNSLHKPINLLQESVKLLQESVNPFQESVKSLHKPINSLQESVKLLQESVKPIEATLSGTSGGKVCSKGGATAQGFSSASSLVCRKRASVGTLHTGQVSALMRTWLESAQFGFWTTAVNGVAAQRRAEQAALADAQRLLVDGRGACVARPPSVEAGAPIGPQEEVVLPFALHANLPGRYTNTLNIECKGLPQTSVGLQWEVSGHPLLLDPTTAGLTKDENAHDILLMTPVVAFLGSSHRVLRVINRLPREVCASVEVHLNTSSFTVLAVNEEEDASRVVLTLECVSDSVKQNSAERYGAAAATPSSFHMPALSTKEIYIEYTPNAKFVERLMPCTSFHEKDSNRDGDIGRTCGSPRGGSLNSARMGSHDHMDEEEDGLVLMQSSQEEEWNGCLVINCKLAESPFNDIFLIDEFYEQNQAVYPSKRLLRRYAATAEKGGGGAQKISSKMPLRALQKKNLDLEETAAVLPTSLRLVPVLQLFQPLRTRPGKVVRLGKLVALLMKEKKLLDGLVPSHRETAVQESIPLSSSRNPPTLAEKSVVDGSEDDLTERDSDTEPDNNPNNSKSAQLFEDVGGRPSRPLSVLLAEDRERGELLAYLKRRRSELTEESQRYFNPIELRLRARCGVPRLMLTPPVSQVEFQAYLNDGKPVFRTMRVMNRNTAMLRFYFHLFTGKNSKMEGESARYGSFTVVSVERLRSEEEPEADSEGRKRSTTKGKPQPTPLNGGSLTSTGALGKGPHRVHSIGPSGAPGKVIYELRSFESLDVTLAYWPPGRGFSLSPGTSVRDVWGGVRVEFVPSEGACSTLGGGGLAAASPNSRGLTASFALERAPVQEIRFHVPLAVPNLSSDVSSLWFRPGNIILDGRAQLSYTQHITLYNHASIAVEYEMILADGMSADSIALPNTADSHASENDESKTATSSAKTTAHSCAIVADKHDIREKIDALHNMSTSPIFLLADGESGTTTNAISNATPAMANRHSLTVQGYLTAATTTVVRGKAAAERFVLSPLKGWVPAATAGGQPGSSVVDVVFKAYSNIVYECTFVVLANHQPSGIAIKLIGISRDTEL
ncbi:unnamed protein product [Phytomonas sp. Hart1]|nr:unnamed protein product [Phytomonas sp. Hart1]|eukprot:CCW70939.1 unnamed protein product [Phytomonas sp. isolate Hart1]